MPPLTDEMIDMLVEHTERITSPRSYTIVFHLGGAIARVREDATAYTQRDAAHNVNINAVWLAGRPGGRRPRAVGARMLRRARQTASGRAYVNFLGDEGQDRVRAAYGEEKYTRLGGAQGHLRPGQLLPPNANIEPTATLARSRS